MRKPSAESLLTGYVRRSTLSNEARTGGLLTCQEYTADTIALYTTSVLSYKDEAKTMPVVKFGGSCMRKLQIGVGEELPDTAPTISSRHLFQSLVEKGVGLWSNVTGVEIGRRQIAVCSHI